MGDFWKGKTVLVTGATGFLGKHVTNELESRVSGPNFLHLVGSECDLTSEIQTKYLFVDVSPDIVIHLAALAGGIGANSAGPASFMITNMFINNSVFLACQRFGVKKLVTIGSVCAYPKITPRPFREVDIFNGYPEETNAPYGIAKRALLVMGWAYRQQYGMNAIHLIPTNLYGPHDNFDPKKSHVIPALIKKCIEAKISGVSSIDVWGSGGATRDFLFARDAAQAIVNATEHYNEAEPINLGSGKEITIKELAGTITSLLGYEGKLNWQPDKPDGQPARVLDTTRAKKHLNWAASTALDEGLSETIAWYLENL